MPKNICKSNYKICVYFRASAVDCESSNKETENDKGFEVLASGQHQIYDVDLAMNHASSSLQYKNQCPECHKIFARPIFLQKHTLTVHGFEMLYSCPKCPDLKFKHSKELHRHRNEIHGNTCEKCGKVLSSMVRLIEHYERVHKTKFTFSCPICKKSFSRRLDLRTHRKGHVANRSVLLKDAIETLETDEEKMWASNPCCECGRVFFSGKTLNTHLLEQHEKKMSKEEQRSKRRKCYFCAKYYVIEQRHWVHMKFMHPDKKVEFPCELCQDNCKVFQTTDDLLVHYNTYHDTHNSIHTCHLCKWPFSTSDNLKAHIEIHIRRKLDPNILNSMKIDVCHFNCWFCWEMFPTQEKLNAHLKRSRRHQATASKLEFSCDDMDCPRNQAPFAGLEELKTHFENEHSDKETFPCDRCSWPFLSEGVLGIHKMNHVPRRKGKYKCPICGSRGVLLSSLKDHWNKFHGAKLKLHRCEHCQERFQTKAGVGRHVSEVHRSTMTETGVACEKCGNFFGDEEKLESHLKNVHGNHQCSECGIAFEQYAKLKTHMQNVHAIGKQHLCPICGKRFWGKSVLENHVACHENGTWFECHLCGALMKDLTNLKKHLVKCSKKKMPTEKQKFVCGECGKGYSRKDSLDDHVRVMHSNETHRVWACEKCGKKFQRHGSLINHQKSATACQARIHLPDFTVNSLKLENVNVTSMGLK